MFKTSLNKKRAAGLVLVVVILGLFLAFNRFPKLDTVRGDLDGVKAPNVECFQGFCIERNPDSSFLSNWWDFSVIYLRLVTVGMTFALLMAGLTEAFLFPRSSGSLFPKVGLIKGTLRGMVIGPVVNLCSACIAPVAASFRRRGGGIAGTLAMVQGSSTLNLPALVMVALVFAPMLGGSRVVLSLVGALLIGPLVALVIGERGSDPGDQAEATPEPQEDASSWNEALTEGLRDWAKASVGFLVRLGPLMVVAGLASGLVIQWLSLDTVTTYLGNNVLGVAIAATFGILINVPLLFEIPLVALLLILGMGTAPAAALLFTAAAGGPVTFWTLARLMPKRGIVTFAAATWAVGIIGGVVVLSIDALGPGTGLGLRESVASASAGQTNTGLPARGVRDSSATAPAGRAEVVPSNGANGVVSGEPVTPFTNVARDALKNFSEYWNDYVWNYRPGVVVFDYDRDGDLDFYITAESGFSNFLYRNEGDGTFQDVAKDAGVAAVDSYGSGAIACDVNNDGYQDLYVGARGVTGTNLDYRSAYGEGERSMKLRKAVKDRLFVNNRDGTFTEITDSAFGDAVNYRSAGSIACADVDGDGWLDFYVGNTMSEDFLVFDTPSNSGHYNLLYRNNGDLTFDEIAESAGVRGPEIVMLDPEGQPVLFEDPETGLKYEGHDPTQEDSLGNPVGEPTGRTHAVLFFDHDDDGDLDLWLANDGDILHVFRNDSSPGEVRFTPVGVEMGLDTVGAWMGFAVGDFDGDVDLDLFITNVGYQALLRPPFLEPVGDCEYHHAFEWGTCLNFLLRNDGVSELPGVGTVGVFTDVAHSTEVTPSPFMPPESLDPSVITAGFQAPTGLAAYDFGFGTTFFDMENDGDQDLYWLGSEVAMGQGPGGAYFPSAGRMMRGDGRGSFEDITVRAHLLDVYNVKYSRYDLADPEVQDKLRDLRIGFHQNGKGLAHGDLDGDGYVDLIGTNSSGKLIDGDTTVMQRGPVFVWMNGGDENHWITLRLTGRMAIDGTGSNADGIGARVYVKTAVDGEAAPLIQVQEVRAGSSYLSMDSIDLEFGLGTAKRVDEIIVLWPSGREQILKDVRVDRVVSITEPAK